MARPLRSRQVRGMNDPDCVGKAMRSLVSDSRDGRDTYGVSEACSIASRGMCFVKSPRENMLTARFILES